MTRCPPICGESRAWNTRKKQEVRKTEDEKKIKELVPRKF